MTNEAKIHKDFKTWKNELNKLCLELYVIDTVDMGFEEDDLRLYWSQKSTPRELTEHFGSKYDLIRAEGWMRID